MRCIRKCGHMTNEKNINSTKNCTIAKSINPFATSIRRKNHRKRGYRLVKEYQFTKSLYILWNHQSPLDRQQETNKFPPAISASKSWAGIWFQPKRECPFNKRMSKWHGKDDPSSAAKRTPTPYKILIRRSTCKTHFLTYFRWGGHCRLLKWPPDNRALEAHRSGNGRGSRRAWLDDFASFDDPRPDHLFTIFSWLCHRSTSFKKQSLLKLPQKLWFVTSRNQNPPLRK
jgi:hypothetical protein